MRRHDNPPYNRATTFMDGTATIELPLWDGRSSEQRAGGVDQLQPYEQELRTEWPAFESSIPYWFIKRTVWLQLARMAHDILITPAMSDKPERVSSVAGRVLAPLRRCLASDSMQWLL
jgi:hypothetical protein